MQQLNYAYVLMQIMLKTHTNNKSAFSVKSIPRVGFINKPGAIRHFNMNKSRSLLQ